MDQKSQIIDQQTHTHIDIQSTQTNLNSQIYSMNTSFTNAQHYHQYHHSSNRNNYSPQLDQENQFCTQHQIQSQINRYQQQQISDPNQQQYTQTVNYQQQTSGVNQQQNIYTVNQQQQYKPKKTQLDLQAFAISLESIEYSLTKIFYRSFHNKLISFYIQSLKQDQRKQRQTNQIQIKLLKQQNWPFKQLFYKRYRNQNEQIMFEFVNMCAQKIQATFKGYITYKRHKQAIKKITAFKTKLGAILIGWKTWNIYNCKKIKEIRKTAINITKQIDSEIENPNLDRFKKMKKIDYLNSSQEVVKENFDRSFKQLFSSGAWIYQVEKCFKKPVNKGKQNKIAHSYQPYDYDQQIPTGNNQAISNQETNQYIEPKPKTRKRQFQGGLNKNNKKSTTPTKPTPSYEDQPIKAKGSYDNTSISTNYQSSQFQERPIVAKGKYQLTEEDIKRNESQFLKLNQNKNNNQNNQQHQSPRVNKFREEEKKKLNKRKKYDPRKAIEEEKLKLQQQKKKKLQNPKQTPPQNPTQIVATGQKKKPQKKVNDISKKTPRVTKKQPQRRDLQSPKQSSKEKTVEKVKKENFLTKKGDNSKSIKLIVNNKKVESKVNCWGPKKDSSQTQIPTNQESSYKSKYLISLKQKTESKMTQGSMIKQCDVSRKLIREQKSISFNEEEFVGVKEDFIKISNKIQKKNTQTDEEQTFQSSYLRKLVEEKEKRNFSYGAGKVPGQRKFIEKVNERPQESYSQKLQQLNNNMKRLSQNRSSNPNLKSTNQHQRKVSIPQVGQIQSQKKKQEVHRSIEFLEDVYSTQYTDRFNTLKNKLNMLESTRYIQRDDTIPILLEDSKFIKKMYKDHAFSSLYWPQVRTMETNFLDYIKFSGF